MSQPGATAITCQEFVEVVTDYLEGQIAAVEQHAIDEHLGECPGCAEYVRQMRLTVKALRGLSGADVIFPQTRDQVLRAFEGAHPPHS
jgi:predicted anti-sigma-YlaC factor YlaD